MRSTRWRAEGALAILVVVTMWVVVGGVIWFGPTTPVHEDAEAVPSTATVAPSTRYAHGAGRRPDYSCVAGAGAFLSTPTDLVRLGSAMLKPGLLQADTIAAFQTPGRLVSGAPTTYALGWTAPASNSPACRCG